MELVRVRWGNAAHITFICFALTTNVIRAGLVTLPLGEMLCIGELEE